MSFPTTFGEREINYLPEDFDLSDNFNVLYISEIHAFEPEYRKEEYKRDIGRQLDLYSGFYNIDRISILGDTGTIEDVEDILGEIEQETEIWIIAGDEDKVDPEKKGNENKDWRGWFEAASSEEPFDVDPPYKIFDEGYETEIQGHKIQAAHHPRKDMRDDHISPPDPRARSSKKGLEKRSPEEMFQDNKNESFIDRLFSVDRDSNEQKESGPPPSMRNGDIFIYDHVHMPYPRKIYDNAVIGLGGRSHNYQIKADSMPLRSLHMNSYSEELVHTLHFDAQKDDIFEHQIFDFSSELEMFDVATPGTDTNNTGYLPLQSRFTRGQFEKEAKEDLDEGSPTLWSNR